MKTKKQIFIEAHQLAKTFTGNYQACFAEALKIIYNDIRIIKTAHFSLSETQLLLSSIKDNKLYISFFNGNLHVKENELFAAELKKYSYKFWSTGEGMQFFFSNEFVNNLK